MGLVPCGASKAVHRMQVKVEAPEAEGAEASNQGLAEGEIPVSPVTPREPSQEAGGNTPFSPSPPPPPAHQTPFTGCHLYLHHPI